MNEPLAFLNELTWGYRASRALQTAVRLHLFTLLDSGPRTGADLAAACQARPDVLEKLLIACCAMGLLRKEGDRFANTDLSQHYLVDGKPQYQGNIIAHASRVWDFWDELPNKIRSVPAQEPPSQPHRDFILGMRDIAAGGRGQCLLDSIDLTGRRRLFDVGGGPGLYSILACQRYPELTAVVFDLPETIAIAREFVEQANLADRITLQAGSWETDDFGSGRDVVLFSNVLHGPTSSAAMKLRKAYDALVPGGMVVIQEFVLNDTKTGPLIPALFNLMVGAYSQAELTADLTEAGFTDVRLACRSEQIGCTWLTAARPGARQ